jgi:hypothetical protein
MSSQQGTTTLGSLKQGSRRWPQVAGGALLAVAIVGAIGLWQVREGSTPSREAVAPAAAATTESAAASVLYLVDSPEEEALLRTFPGGLDQPRVQGGASSVETVVLVGSTIDQATLELLSGMPGTLTVDLRAHADTGLAEAR